MNQESLYALADLLGVTRSYTGLDGSEHQTSPEVAEAFIAGMGLDVSEHTLDRLRRERWTAGVRGVHVARPEQHARVPVVHPKSADAGAIEWVLTQEDGETTRGRTPVSECAVLEEGDYDLERALVLPVLPLGYHRLAVGDSQCRIVCAPEPAFRPPVLDERRVWGPALQLYALRTENNWGVGDFADLLPAIDWFASLGADFIGLNPLHALFVDNPAHCSPYSPSSRRWLNPTYIGVDAVPEVAASSNAQAIRNASEFVAKLESLRATEFVDYPRVAEAKEQVLRAAFDTFRTTDSERYRNFRAWVEGEGEALAAQVMWETLQRVNAAEGRVGFASWPDDQQRPNGAGVRAVVDANAWLCEYHEYLQWIASEQLSAAKERAASRGMALGLYTDLAVGVEGASAERWSRPALYGDGASVGAPPDSFNLQGQDWGMPPPIPHALEEEGLQSFREVLSAAMAVSGAVRIDHVMALRRLYWVPRGRGAAEGAYVLYPFDAMMAVVTLESNRNQCLVVGEDLGVVPPEVTDALRRSRSYSYRILFFEQTGPETYKAPDQMLTESLTVASTHDLPTLKGFWEERDLEVRDELELWPSPAVRDQFVLDRAAQRRGLVDALKRQGLIEATSEVPRELPQSVADALLLYIARGASELMAVQLEDVMGQLEQVNLPGTVDEHPNWKRKLPWTFETLRDDAGRAQLFRAISAARRGA